jgi:aromatic-amino-acid transaminase
MTMNSSPLATLEMAPIDPIISASEAFVADTNTNKVNLSIGIYCNDSGKVPILDCIKHAEQKFVAAGKPKSYLPMDGLGSFNRATQHMLFDAEHCAVRENRVVTAQTLGGTGGLRVGADFLHNLNPQAEVWVSDPSWENHRVLFEGAGFKVNAYPYYDAATHGIRIDAMLETLRQLPRGTIVVLHACCHNPTGLDPTPGQWRQICDVVKQAELIPFLDIAYQGFAEGLDADAAEVRRFADECPLVVVASSFSKSLSLYSERVGALSIVTGSADEARRALSQIKRVVRASYSGPPSYGGCLAANVLTDPALLKQWDTELHQMRDRVKLMRRQLIDKIRVLRADFDLSYVIGQRGMFSYSGLTKEQVGRLRDEYSIYALDSGRVCVAALNSRNIDYVAQAIANVLVA